MSGGASGDARLREAYRSLGTLQETGGDCPTPERLWSAMQGELAQDEALGVLDHASTCPGCIAAMQLARDLAAESAAEDSLAGRPRRTLPRWMLVAAVLMVGLVMLPFVFETREPGSESPIRAEAQPEIRSAIAGAGPLEREQCVLRWTAPAEMASYRVDVTNENLDVVFSTSGLSSPEVSIPAQRLDVVPPGGRILWRVEATIPGGARIVSATFSSTVD